MIVFYVGTPGSGKSYEAVRKIVDNLRLGRVVCTNIDGMESPQCQEYLKNLLDMDDYTFRRLFRHLSSDQVRRFWNTEKIIDLQYQHDVEGDVFQDLVIEKDELICPQGSLIVIDEAHRYFNARDWQAKSNRELADWASTHRHLGYDLILITQDIDKVEKQVRTLTEWCYYFRKVNFFGGAVKKKYLCYSYTGDDHNGKPLAKNVRTYLQQYFPCYQSYSTKDAKEVGFMSHTNILKHPVFYAIPVVLCFCLYMFFQKSSFASGDLFGVSKVQHKYDNLVTQGMKKTAQPLKPVMQNISTPRHSEPVVAGLPAAPVPSASLSLPEYSSYKIDGYLTVNRKTVILINGISVSLPSPHVQQYIPASGIAIAKTLYFGTKQPVFSSQQPVSSSSSSSTSTSSVPDKKKDHENDPFPKLLFSSF